MTVETKTNDTEEKINHVLRNIRQDVREATCATNQMEAITSLALAVAGMAELIVLTRNNELK